ncbi:hypothetical protein OCH239_14060 [Roseivivax halodurans JCM 10272]|uniref:Muramidase n=1 Tax=Roseivivax halodurans JCM 10272 TaxID=1449350 RepID=X7EHJ9_9RHOB|nr:hypothetical protein OCH239_14060 [Roseivivax halodurans JCM 10272]
MRLAGPLVLLCLVAMPLRAEMAGSIFMSSRGAFIPALMQPQAVSSGPSLFANRTGRSLFAPIPSVAGPASPEPFVGLGPSGQGLLGGLRRLIAEAEAGRAGYDAVQHGARIKPLKRPTDMTLREIFAWIEATPGQPHAIGLYQFIPSTLRRVAAIAGVPHDARFDPAMQDRLADILLSEAGLAEARAGRMPRRAFMNNLSKIWAGLPSSSGRSHYHGYAGNRSTITWSRFEEALRPHLPG